MNHHAAERQYANDPAFHAVVNDMRRLLEKGVLKTGEFLAAADLAVRHYEAREVMARGLKMNEEGRLFDGHDLTPQEQQAKERLVQEAVATLTRREFVTIREGLQVSPSPPGFAARLQSLCDEVGTPVSYHVAGDVPAAPPAEALPPKRVIQWRGHVPGKEVRVEGCRVYWPTPQADEPALVLVQAPAPSP
jgi:hypothetical protein